MGGTCTATLTAHERAFQVQRLTSAVADATTVSRVSAEHSALASTRNHFLVRISYADCEACHAISVDNAERHGTVLDWRPIVKNDPTRWCRGDPASCALKVCHPPHGNKFPLGCSLCRRVLVVGVCGVFPRRSHATAYSIRVVEASLAPVPATSAVAAVGTAVAPAAGGAAISQPTTPSAGAGQVSPTKASPGGSALSSPPLAGSPARALRAKRPPPPDSRSPRGKARSSAGGSAHGRAGDEGDGDLRAALAASLQTQHAPARKGGAGESIEGDLERAMRASLEDAATAAAIGANGAGSSDAVTVDNEAEAAALEALGVVVRRVGGAAKPAPSAFRPRAPAASVPTLQSASAPVAPATLAPSIDAGTAGSDDSVQGKLMRDLGCLFLRIKPPTFPPIYICSLQCIRSTYSRESWSAGAARGSRHTDPCS